MRSPTTSRTRRARSHAHARARRNPSAAVRAVVLVLVALLASTGAAATALAQATVTAGLGIDALRSRLAGVEARVAAAASQAVRTGQAYRDAVAPLAALKLTADHARAAHAGEAAKLPAAVRTALETAAPAVAAHHAALGDYFAAYDEASITRMDLKVMEVIQELEAARAEVASKHPDVEAGGLDKALAEVRSAAAQYWNARTITQGKESFKRLYALRHLADAHRKAEAQVRKVLAKTGQLPATSDRHSDRRQGFKHKVSALRGKIRRIAANLRVKASMAPKLGRLVAYLARPGRPDPDRMSELMKELGETFTTRGKVKIDVEGRDRIPAGKKLVFTPSHRSGTVDSMIMVQLMPGRFTPLATFRYYPEWAKPIVGKLLEGEPGLIPVDLPGVDVVARSVETVRSGRSLLIYPEGHIASPLGEIRPLRNGIERITEQLLDEDVALIPVTIDDPAAGWGEKTYANGDRELGLSVKVTMDPPLDPRLVHALSGKHDGLLLGLIRETWHRNMEPGLAALRAPSAAAKPETLEGVAEYREPLFEAVHGQ
jgi:hypothetical protein